MVDKYAPSSVLVRVCENGLYKFAKALIEHGAHVSALPDVVRDLQLYSGTSALGHTLNVLIRI